MELRDPEWDRQSAIANKAAALGISVRELEHFIETGERAYRRPTDEINGRAEGVIDIETHAFYSNMTGGDSLKKEIYCPVCAGSGAGRLLQLVDEKAVGLIYPYCKTCRMNIPILLDGDGGYKQDGEPFRFKKIAI